MRPRARSMPLSFYLVSVYLASCIAPCLAQTSKLFQWQFASNVSTSFILLLIFIVTSPSQSLSTSIPTCLPLPIIVKSFNTTTNATHGTPPYYMLAFAVGGTPITTLIGTDESNLSWTVTHPVGASIFTLISSLNLHGNRISVDTQCSRRKWQRRRDSPEQNDCDRYVSVFTTLKLFYSTNSSSRTNDLMCYHPGVGPSLHGHGECYKRLANLPAVGIHHQRRRASLCHYPGSAQLTDSYQCYNSLRQRRVHVHRPR